MLSIDSLIAINYKNIKINIFLIVFIVLYSYVVNYII